MSYTFNARGATKALAIEAALAGYVMGQLSEGGKVRITNAKTSASALLAVRS